VPVNSSHGELVTGDEFTVMFFTFVTSSPCDDFTVTSYTTDVYSVGVPCPSVLLLCVDGVHAQTNFGMIFSLLLYVTF